MIRDSFVALPNVTLCRFLQDSNQESLPGVQVA